VKREAEVIHILEQFIHIYWGEMSIVVDKLAIHE
jgi:hypothetical protein